MNDKILSHVPRSRLTRRRVLALACGGGLLAAVVLLVLGLALAELRYLCCNREALPDLGPLVRFEVPTIGHVYDAEGLPLLEFAHEQREILHYTDIPPIVQHAILAAEDKRFFSHNGVDYASLLRVIGKIRGGVLAARLLGRSPSDTGMTSPFPQGGSTITQQLVRGAFLRSMTTRENSTELRPTGIVASALSWLMAPRSVNMLARKREEIRMAWWLEQAMEAHFGSKQRAKEEILARYATLVYLGEGQYGFARAAEHYFGRSLATFTSDDADKAALLAGIVKAPRDYAPSAANTARVVRRRNETLALMQASGFISSDTAADAARRPLWIRRPTPAETILAPAVAGHMLAELEDRAPGLGADDLLQGRIAVHVTVDRRVQQAVNEALEHGLEAYEQRHPAARGVIQGAAVVLHNSDGRILAEAGGRRLFNGRPASVRDYNRVTQSRRQPGSAMKPLVYLAAFREGGFTLDTLVPDEPIGVADGTSDQVKWIANYDGRFQGDISMRQALAESRNAVAVWLASQIGIDSVLQTALNLGIQTPLRRYPSTALGASETSLLELASAYRTMASGLVGEPYLIRAVRRASGDAVAMIEPETWPTVIDAGALAMIQEGMRGAVRLPTGTAHALAARRFPIAVMGKTGTTNDYRDAIFVGSTYGPSGITVAVRIGFDDNRSLGPGETGSVVALPVFEDVMRSVYEGGILGPAPVFPADMEGRITASLLPPPPSATADSACGLAGPAPELPDGPSRCVPASLPAQP